MSLATNLLLAVALLAAIPAHAETLVPRTVETSDQLIVFVQPGQALDDAFLREQYPAIETLADELDIELRVLDARDGAPVDVALTPLIVFQNYRGRSIYQGRYTKLDKLRLFIRTSRVVPQGTEPFTAENVPVRRLGRARVASYVKVTPLTGAVPDDFTTDAFDLAAIHAIVRGLDQSTYRTSIDLGRSDRRFHLDFYPYLSRHGELMISLALYSQFNCVDPVFTTSEPVSGRWDDMETVFEQAASILQIETMRIIHESKIGDGFDVVASAIADTSWESLGLALPAAPQGVDAALAAGIAMPRAWMIDSQDVSAGPRLQYRFLPPLDNYAGEATELDAQLVFGDAGAIAGASGYVEIQTASVTTGDDDLDGEIHGKVIKVKRFPISRFTLERIEGDVDALRFGETAKVLAYGTFEFVGIEIPLSAHAQLQPLLAEDGTPRLWVSASAKFNVKRSFGLEGPLGPSPASEMIDIHVNMIMVPIQSDL